MLLRDVRDYIASLGIAEDEHCYCGKMADKKQKCIGVYHLKRTRDASPVPGGEKNLSYGIKSVSILVHWNGKQAEAEETALRLQKALKDCREVLTGECRIKFIHVYYEEPVPVDTDENGIYEYVIECDIYHERG